MVKMGHEIWIVDNDGAHGLFYKSMIEYVTIDNGKKSKIRKSLLMVSISLLSEKEITQTQTAIPSK